VKGGSLSDKYAPHCKAMEIDETLIAGLAPYRTQHINRFGDYSLNFERKIEPMVFNVNFLQ
jgi:hypothetical protein